MQYQIKQDGKVIVGSYKIVDLDHALEIKAAIDNPMLGIEVEVVEVVPPVIPRELPKLGYVLFYKDGEDSLSLQVGESAYGGWTFTEEGYDRECRLYERSDGHPHTVLVYAASSSEAFDMAHRIRALFEAKAPEVAEIKRRLAEEEAAYEDDDEDDDE